METATTMTNPYDWINPITDPELFAGRKEELSVILEEIVRLKGKTPIRPIIALPGERRVGKTSILKRIQENCEQESIKGIFIPIDESVVTDGWDFWHEVFTALLLTARDLGILIGEDRVMGFGPAKSDHPKLLQRPLLQDLFFPKEYEIHLRTSGAEPQSSFSIQNDFKEIISRFEQMGYEGLVLLIDEAHILLETQVIKQQLRNAIQVSDKIGIVFAGERRMSHMFTDPSEPFYGQANVIPLQNFTHIDDVAECALLPLSYDELKLMSPMTIDYVARLSRGKPNQIRLICSSMYRRFMNGRQDDLNITIDVLDDVLDNIAQAYDFPDLRKRVQAIQNLNSVDIELLFNMTRYPNWNIQDIINLDESFRGESRSSLAAERRKRNLRDKQKEFIRLGLMVDDPDRYMLAGGEFLSLYLRFFYETRKYGELSRKLILGMGPPTPFGEVTEKLVRSFLHSFGQVPELQRLIFHKYHRDFGDIIGRVMQRFAVLKDFKNGKKPSAQDMIELLSECFRICELIGKEGSYYLLCLSVRSRDNPRELIQVELYFDLSRNYEVDLVSLFNLLNQQAEDARVLIEGYKGFWVKLPDLTGLLAVIGTTPDDLLQRLPLVEKWSLESIQYAIQSHEMEDRARDQRQETDEYEKYEWAKLYSKGYDDEAEQNIIQMLDQTAQRNRRAKLYNDLGYIRFGDKLKKNDLSRKDLETALDLHYSNLPITLLNLSCLDIDDKNYTKAIERIEAALLITLSPTQLKVDFLRLRLPENHLGFRVKWEQHPASILEASYINLAYAHLKDRGFDEGFRVLQEGSELLPSSIRLKHATARFYLFKKRADLADPIYRELYELPSLKDRGIAGEIRRLGKRITGKRTRRKKSKAKRRK